MTCAVASLVRMVKVFVKVECVAGSSLCMRKAADALFVGGISHQQLAFCSRRFEASVPVQVVL